MNKNFLLLTILMVTSLQSATTNQDFELLDGKGIILNDPSNVFRTKIQAPSDLNNNVTLTLPSTMPQDGQILVVNNNGKLSWIDNNSTTTNSNNQKIDKFILDGDKIKLSLEKDGEVDKVIDLSSITTFLKYSDVQDNLTSLSKDKPLSANQGRVLVDTLNRVLGGLTTHTKAENPHKITKDKLGLANVDNTSDSNKPISDTTKTALDLKANTADIQDNLTSIDPKKPLSANQGKILSGLINTINSTMSDSQGVDLFDFNGTHLTISLDNNDTNKTIEFDRNLTSLNDVNLSNLTSGKVLTYDESSSKWIAKELPDGTKIFNDLNSTSQTQALSAKQGKVLDEKIKTNDENITKLNRAIINNKTVLENNLTILSTNIATKANKNELDQNLLDINSKLDTKLNKTDMIIVDDLTSIDTNKSLSANQGMVLKGLIDTINNNKDINLTDTNSSNKFGVIYKNGEPFIHNFNYGDNGTVVTDGRNIFIGLEAGNLYMGGGATQNLHASYNTAVGAGSLSNNSEGFYNTATGAYALFSNRIGHDNIANGISSLNQNKTGSKNTATGVNSLYSNISGSNNIAVGYNAGHYVSDDANNTAGNKNIFIGSDTKAKADGDTNEIVIGSKAIGEGSNSVVLGNNAITRTILRGTVTATKFVGDGSELTGLPTATVAADITPILGGNLDANNSDITNVKDLTFNGVLYKDGAPFIHNFNYGKSEKNITTIGHNTFIGKNAGNLTMGKDANETYKASGNTAVGWKSLNLNTTGYNNTANGLQALYLNTTGNSNTANGANALSNNTAGSNNTANGLNSLFLNTIGVNNTANGLNALHNNISGGDNTAIGLNALYSNKEGNFTTAVGSNAGRFLNSGTSKNETGVYNLFLGYNTRALNDGDRNEIVIGANAKGEGNNSVVIGDQNIKKTILKGNIGIGTKDPLSPLEISSEQDAILKLRQNESGTPWNYIEFLNDTERQWYIGQDNSGRFRISDFLIITPSGNIGIGNQSPQRKLDINGVMHLTPSSSSPLDPTEGDIYMDSTSHKLMVYDGTNWNACW